MNTQTVNINYNNISNEMINNIINMLFISSSDHNSQIIKSLDVIIKIQKRFNITMMPTYLILKLMLIISVLQQNNESKDILKILQIDNENEARKLFKEIVQKNNLGEGNIIFFYKSGDKLYNDFLHLIGLFGNTFKALNYPLHDRYGIQEMSSICGINFNYLSNDELKDIQCVITTSFKEKICFKPSFKYIENESDDVAKLYWQGNKDQIRSYILHDTYHWLEIDTYNENYSFVFIVSTDETFIPLSMNNIIKNCEEKLIEKNWCRFVIEKNKFLKFKNDYILYISDLDLSMDKFIDKKNIKPIKNGINYNIDLEFCNIDEKEDEKEDKKEDLDESNIKIINACNKNIQFILLNKTHKIPLLFGKLI